MALKMHHTWKATRRMQLVRGILVTSEPLDAYGGFQFDEDQVREIGRLVKTMGLPMGTRHDPRTYVDAKVVDTVVQRNDEGYLQLVVEWEIDDDEWGNIEGEELRGLSISVTDLVRQSGSEPVASLSADAHWFSDDELNLAYEELAKITQSAEIRRLYQFSFDPPTMVVLALVVSQIPTITVGLVTNCIYDALKHFIHPDSKPSIFSLKFEDRESGTKMTAYVETNSKRLLKHAIDQLPDALRMASDVEFVPEGGVWKATKARS